VRKIRQSLDNSPKQVILFTSTEHGHGKTTIIQALAYSMSLSRKKVLLIDTNFCNNDLTTQTQAKATLEKFSVTGSLKDMDLEELVTHSDIPGVDIVGCEGGDYTPQEILSAGNLLEHMDDLKKRYDYILLESAPMNSYTDTRELIKYVDGVVSVFSAEAVIKPADTDAIEYLKNLNGKFQGAILNKVGLDNMQA
jgi:Mrp family chromosome partitioning ATPase